MENKTKYIFVTGGVASGLGKGIVAASLGRLLKSRGYRVSNQKFDPYINVDPSFMSPIQHGEVFVTDDGAECDLDVGHYERFTDENLTKNANITAGKIYLSVLEKERRGDYNGKTVQVVPHITNHIKDLIVQVAKDGTRDIVITEIGGTVGDMESRPFLEAFRQMVFDVGRENVLYVHVTLLPYLEKGGEIKTKPTQHSVKELLSMGIQPDMIVCRTSRPLTDEVKDKIALFCNVAKDCVIENMDADSIYQVPLLLEEQNFAQVALRRLGLADHPANLDEWRALVKRQNAAADKITISLVGKYTVLHDAYFSTIEALKAAGFATGAHIDINWVPAESLEKGDTAPLQGSHGILIGGGFGVRGLEGKIAAAKFARKNKIPCLAIGMGAQAMAIDFARNVIGLAGANSTEFDESTPHPIAHNIYNKMRLGSCPCKIAEGTLAAGIYKAAHTDERHRHRYEFNAAYRTEFKDHGLIFSGESPDGRLLEMLELKSDIHPWFLGTIFSPQFKSRPNVPHPIFAGFIAACNQRPSP
ncbi:MAG: CTP synthase [Clostridiales bacterium]|jgi:CTP synthase|nr:CTP synthase [Clostridiales bacterium]